MVSSTNQDPTAAIQTGVVETVASTVATQTTLTNTVASIVVALATKMPEFTFTPSLTPTPIFTLTPSVPMVSVSLPTNCRSGPGTAYDILGLLNAGESAEVVGRNTSSDNWIIRLPYNPAITCWLWGQYATVVGNTSGLPVYNSPTPVAYFNVPAASYDVIYFCPTVCDGYYMIRFQITNNGSVTLESNQVITTDQTTGETKTTTLNTFPIYNVCSQESIQEDLSPGEVGGTTNSGFSSNPVGHAIKATIRVCSQDNMAGTCLEKTFTFTP